MATYIALLRKDPGSDYSVEFPDFPGCITAGESLEEARRLAQEALDLHVRGMVEDGEALPAPTTLDVIMGDPGNREAVAFLVAVSEEPEQAVRINVTMPAKLLRQADAYAEQHGYTRSGLLQRSVRRVLEDAANRRGNGPA